MEISEILTSIHLSDYYHYIIFIFIIVGIFSFFFPSMIIYFLMIVSFGLLILLSGFILSHFKVKEGEPAKTDNKYSVYFKQVEFLLIVSSLIICYIADELNLTIANVNENIKELQMTFSRFLRRLKK